MSSKVIVVATHGHCFDGLASAALFTHLLRSLQPGAELTMRYRSCGYGPGMSMVPPEWLEGDENAILDFRFTPTDRLTWYFDHHVTGFGSQAEREAAEARAAGEAGKAPLRLHYEPSYSSCTKLIADVAKRDFGVTAPSLEDLVEWADVIDAARFESAERAVRRDEPVLQLASVVEHHGDGPFLGTVVPRLLERGLAEVARSEDVQALWRPLASAQEAFRARVQQKAERVGSVVLVDLTEAPIEVGAKFVTYALFPESVYSVMLTRSKSHCKVSVGYNPWCGQPRRHDIASICRRYEGGGHPVVGAASFPLAEVERARDAARAIARELDTT